MNRENPNDSTRQSLPPTGDGRQQINQAADRVILLTALAALAMAALMMGLMLQRSTPAALLPAGGFTITLMMSLFMLVGRKRIAAWLRVIGATGPMLASLILYAALIDGSGLPAAGTLLAAAFIIASWSLEGRQADGFITLGIFAAMLCSLADIYPPYPQLSASRLVWGSLVSFATLSAVYAAMLLTQRLRSSLRMKILLGALLILLVPSASIAFIDNSTMRSALQSQTNQALFNSANMVANRVDEFIMTNRASIAVEAQSQVYASYLKLDPRQRSDSVEARELEIALDSFIAGLKTKERAFLVSYALLDQLGANVFSSSLAEVGQAERNTDYFLTPTGNGRPYVSEIEFSPADHQAYIYFSQIVKDPEQKLLGVLRARFDANIFQSYASEFTGALGESSYPILLDENLIRLADPKTPALQWKAAAVIPEETFERLADERRIPAGETRQGLIAANDELSAPLANAGDTVYFTARMSEGGTNASAAAVRLNSRPWTVTFSQSQDVLLAAVKNQSERATLVATLVAGAVALLATLAAQIFSNPIQALTTAAERISGGDLAARAQVRSEDEIGLLARTFNAMAAQIRELIGGLEERVNERTRELAEQNNALRFRARQLETVADVARGAASSRKLEELLATVTRLVSDRFDFYHAGIFLLDERKEYAVLRAANSEGGQHMLARKHRLLVGQTGIVGHVTSIGKARIATDVGQDATFFNNPDLPLTRSEMALPLKIGEQIIGALDVQSTEPNAFSQDDIQLFTILADQVAIAIHNNQLYTETAQALEEAERVHQRYLRQAWQHEQEQYRHLGYHFDGQQAHPASPVDEPVIQLSLETGKTTASKNGLAALAVPVKVRGETIGVIRVREDDLERPWDEQETTLMQSIADQMGVALENARLFAQTTRRAARDRNLMEITSKIRSTNNPQEMLQIAAEEIRRVLNASTARIVMPGGESSGENGTGQAAVKGGDNT